MKDIRHLHREAIGFSRRASFALENGDSTEYLQLAAKAFELEREAAMELIQEFDAEPTRSVLLRSAATLAYNIGNYTESQTLIYFALAGRPYYEIEEELQALLENTKNAIETDAPKTVGLQNAYIENLREHAVNIRLEPSEQRYSHAIVIDYIADFLKNIQNCFSNFSEVNFRKNFQFDDFPDFDKTLNIFKKDTRVLCVGLRFKSFGASVAVDTTLQNYRDIVSPKFKEFKSTLFDLFKAEILMADFNSSSYQEAMETKYSGVQRSRIFSPIIESIKEKAKYRVSIVDKDFKTTIKSMPLINKSTIAVLKPSLANESISEDSEVLIKRTLELTNAVGQKVEKILSENLEYAEFKVTINNINWEKKQAYFINPYEQKVIFNRGIFSIDDEYYKIYVEATSFKEIESLFARDLIGRYTALLEQVASAGNNEADLSLDVKIALDAFRTTIIKGW
jgi:hypothetical protein